LPFVGGWVGYLAYEAGRFVEPTAFGRRSNPGDEGRKRPVLPVSNWALYDTVLLHDKQGDRWTAAGVELPSRLSREDRPPIGERLASIERFVAKAVTEPADGSPAAPVITSVRWNFSKDAYIAKVCRALDYIRAGDIFQVNLARRCRLACDAPPIEVYERLRRSNPSAFAAYLPVSSLTTGGAPAAVLSSSPELFLDVRSGTVITRPIKGTRPRGATPAEDEVERLALATSEKDRAELNMIIDLERNDLGRVCEYGSVRVLSDGDIEQLATVFHRTATVTGRLRDNTDAIDLLRATFPGGSITGAPKVRAMQIIDELEPSAREVYTGAIGYIGLDGSMALNIAIRTMLAADGHVDVMVGSGIVADSQPEAEYEELQAKAAGMLRAFDRANAFDAKEEERQSAGRPGGTACLSAGG
jgi:para-aminobenzoate synthetase component 1